MIGPCWRTLIEPADVAAVSTGLWTKVYDYLEGPLKLRFEASGTWLVASGAACGPDGLRTDWPAECLLGTAPRGALVGMIGGSTAERPANLALAAATAAGVGAPSAAGGAGTVFVVGSYCVLVVPDTLRGALFLTMNDAVDRFDGHGGSLRVTVSAAR